ncbi:hypothetical protein K3495_g13818, partial [Podosphaera aphanis]
GAVLHSTRDRCITTRPKGQTRIIEHYDPVISISILYKKGNPDNLHITRQLSPPLTINGVVRFTNPTLKWLGVFLDTKLSFKEHVQVWSARTQRISAHIRQLGNTYRGVAVAFLRSAALAAALPVLFYGAEAWWRGHSYSRRGRQTSTRSQYLLDIISRALVTLARAILPVFRTTPTLALLREVCLKPAHILLEEVRLRSAVRLAAADSFHSSVRRSNDPRAHTCLTEKLKLVPRFPRPQLLPPSYKAPLNRSRVDFSTHEFFEHIRALPSWDIIVYSDGSKQIDGSAGAGAVVLHKNVTLAKVRVPLGPDFEVYDSEITGALAGLKAAVAAPTSHLATNIQIILDNQEAAQRLLDISPSKSSQAEILEFRDLAARWPTRRIFPSAAFRSAEQIHFDCINELYAWCRARNYFRLWTYLFINRYAPDVWKLWARSANPDSMLVLKTTMIIVEEQNISR